MEPHKRDIADWIRVDPGLARAEGRMLCCSLQLTEQTGGDSEETPQDANIQHTSRREGLHLIESLDDPHEVQVLLDSDDVPKDLLLAVPLPIYTNISSVLG